MQHAVISRFNTGFAVFVSMVLLSIATLPASAQSTTEPVAKSVIDGQLCTLDGGVGTPVFDASKRAFLSGDFGEFLRVATLRMSENLDSLNEPIKRLTELFPDGFIGCRVVAQRVDIGGMIQEVITFETKANFPMSLYLLAIPMRGQLEITYLNFNTEFNMIIDQLR